MADNVPSALEAAQKLKALLLKASPAPWVDPRGRDEGADGPYLASEGGRHVGRFDYADNGLADKRFIAAARNDLPAILDSYLVAVEALEKGLARLTAIEMESGEHYTETVLLRAALKGAQP